MLVISVKTSLLLRKTKISRRTKASATKTDRRFCMNESRRWEIKIETVRGHLNPTIPSSISPVFHPRNALSMARSEHHTNSLHWLCASERMQFKLAMLIFMDWLRSTWPMTLSASPTCLAGIGSDQRGLIDWR